MDVNGDGIPGIQTGAFFRERPLQAPDRLESVVDGLGAVTTVEYRPYQDSSIYTSTLFNGLAPTCNAPLLCSHPRGMLVSKLKEFPDSTSVVLGRVSRTHRYEYKGSVTGAGARGLLGFEQRIIELLDSGGRQKSLYVEQFDNRSFEPIDATTPKVRYPRAMRPKLTQRSAVVGNIAFGTKTSVVYNVRSTIPGSYAVNEQSRTVQRGRKDLLVPGPLPILEFDDVLGTEQHRVVSADEFNNVLQYESIFNPREKRVVTIEYKHTPAGSAFRTAWLLSHPTKITDSYTVTPTTGTPAVKTRVTEHDYYSTGLLFATTVDRGLATQLVTTFTRTPLGNPKVISEAGSGTERKTTVTYDLRDNYPINVANTLGHVSEVQYDPRTGELEAVRDPNKLLTLVGFDGFGRPAVQVSPDKEVTKTTYEWLSFDRPFAITETSNTGARQQTQYDTQGRARAHDVLAPRGKTLRQTIDYDEHGRVSRASRFTDSTQPSSPGVTYNAYDNLDRPTQLTLPGGEVVRNCYDLRTACTTNPRGYTTCSTQDDRGRTVRALDPVLQVCDTARTGVASRAAKAYTYGPFDVPATITDLKGNITEIITDHLGRTTELRDKDRGTETTTYNAFGEVATFFNGNREETRFVYDTIGRLTLRREVNARGTGVDGLNSFTYDGGAVTDTAAGELIGYLTSSSSADGIGRVFAYKKETGTLSSTTQTVGTVPFKTAFEFDDFGRLKTIAYPQATGLPAVTVRNAYDAGQLTAVYDNAASDTAPPHWALSDTSINGLPSLETFGNGLQQSRTYDPHGRLDVTRVLSGSNALFALDTDYDANGNVSARNIINRNQRETYQYDAHDRLSQDSFGRSPTPRTFGYDEIGRFTSMTYDAVHPHAVKSDGTLTHEYDLAGNRTKSTPIAAGGKVKRFAYTFFGKPKTIWDETRTTPITKSSEVQLQYDADMSRVVKTGPSGITTYMDGLYEQRVPKTGPTEHIYYITNGARTVAQVTMKVGAATVTSYLHDDHLGSPRLVSRPFKGTPPTPDVTELDYDAFGTPRNPDWSSTAPPKAPGVTIGFTSHEMDDEHGLINMQGRIYDPRTFQFISPDPFVQSPFSSTGLNRYAYVMHNPVTRVDPTGYQDVPTPHPDPTSKCVYVVDCNELPRKESKELGGEPNTQPPGAREGTTSTSEPGGGKAGEPEGPPSRISIDMSAVYGSGPEATTGPNEPNHTTDKATEAPTQSTGLTRLANGDRCVGDYCTGSGGDYRRSQGPSPDKVLGDPAFKHGQELARNYGILQDAAMLFVPLGAIEKVGQVALSRVLPRVGARIARVVNSKMPHAAGRAVTRAGYASEKEARTALQAFGDAIKQGGLPKGTVVDAKGHLVVPGFGEGGAVVYRQAGDKLTLQTVVTWIEGMGTPLP